MFVPNNNPPGYKENAIYFIAFAFRKCVTIIEWIANMQIYVSDNEESYKYTIIAHLGNAGTEYLLLHIVQCWRTREFDKETSALSIVL